MGEPKGKSCYNKRMGKKTGSDPKRHQLEVELQAFFANEVNDERLWDVEITRIEVSADRKYVQLYYLPPGGAEEIVAEAMEDLLPRLIGCAAEVLFHAPRFSLKLDRGAGNKRRVSEILDELRDDRKLTPGENSG